MPRRNPNAPPAAPAHRPNKLGVKQFATNLTPRHRALLEAIAEKHTMGNLAAALRLVLDIAEKTLEINVAG